MSAMFSGDSIEDMEIAKRLIARYPHLDLVPIIAIASNREQPASARIAAIYTLGFTDDNGMSLGVLRSILGASDEPLSIRDHAAEAVESITRSR